MDFKNVVSADDFVARQQKLMEKHANEMAQHRLPGATAPELEVQRPRGAPRVFVIMPFRPGWADDVYAMIRRAASGLGLSPEPLVHRADEINRQVTRQYCTAQLQSAPGVPAAWIKFLRSPIRQSLNEHQVRGFGTRTTLAEHWDGVQQGHRHVTNRPTGVAPPSRQLGVSLQRYMTAL